MQLEVVRVALLEARRYKNIKNKINIKTPKDDCNIFRHTLVPCLLPLIILFNRNRTFCLK